MRVCVEVRACVYAAQNLENKNLLFAPDFKAVVLYVAQICPATILRSVHLYNN